MIESLLVPINFFQWVAGVVMLSLSFYCLRCGKFPLARALSYFLLTMSVWALGAAVIFHLDSLEAKILVNRIRMLSPLLCGPTVLNLANQMRQRSLFPTWVWSLLFAIPAIGAVLMLSPWHELVLRDYKLDQVGKYAILTFENGPWFLVHNLFTRILIMLSLVVIPTAYSGAHRQHHINTYLVFASLTIPFIIDSAAVFYYPYFRFLHLTPAFLMITGIILMVVIYRYHFFSAVPIARTHVLDSSDDLYLIFDLQEHLVDFNQTATTVLKVTEADMGRPRGAIEEKIGVRLLPEIPERVVAGVSYRLEHTELRDERGTVMGSLYKFTNVTLRRQVEENVQDLNRLKNQLLSLVGHGLHGNLEALRTHARALAETATTLSPTTVQTQATLLADYAEKCVSYVDEVLLWSRSQQDKLRMLNNEVQLVPVVEQSVMFMLPFAEMKGQSIKVTSQTKPSAVTDSAIVATVTRNLLSNAIKFSPIDSQIEVVINQQNAEVWIEVHDKGPALKEPIEALIGSSHDQGLGLFICNDLAAHIGGRLEAQAQQLGVGSTFRLVLPTQR